MRSPQPCPFAGLRATLNSDGLPGRVRSGSLANTAEISSNNIRSGAALDNIKATWNQVLIPGFRGCIAFPSLGALWTNMY